MQNIKLIGIYNGLTYSIIKCAKPLLITYLWNLMAASIRSFSAPSEIQSFKAIRDAYKIFLSKRAFSHHVNATMHLGSIPGMTK